MVSMSRTKVSVLIKLSCKTSLHSLFLNYCSQGVFVLFFVFCLERGRVRAGCKGGAGAEGAKRCSNCAGPFVYMKIDMVWGTVLMKFVQLDGVFYSALNYSLVCSPLTSRTSQGIQTLRPTN